MKKKTKCNQDKCKQCQFFDKKAKERTDDCPNKDRMNFDFSACTDFLINDKLVNF